MSFGHCCIIFGYMRRISRGAHILLLALVLLNVTGMGLLWLLRLNLHRTAMENKMILKNMLSEVLIVDGDTVENHPEIFEKVNKKEIRFEGRMYDVISMSKVNNQYVIRCISDKREDILRSEMKKHFADSGQNVPLNKKKLKISTDDFLPVSPLISPIPEIHASTSPGVILSCTDTPADKHTPPPKKV